MMQTGFTNVKMTSETSTSEKDALSASVSQTITMVSEHSDSVVRRLISLVYVFVSILCFNGNYLVLLNDILS